MCKELKCEIKKINEGIVSDLIKSSKKNNVCEMNAYLNQKLHTFQ
jgi:hypothetical protein